MLRSLIVCCIQCTLVQCISFLHMKMSALCYFNGKFNIFEYILPNKTCQSYSWVTLSDIVSCDTTHEVYISGDISTFLEHNVNCKMTKKTPNANLCVCPENSKWFWPSWWRIGLASDLRLVSSCHDADVNCVFSCQFVDKPCMWTVVIYSNI